MAPLLTSAVSYLVPPLTFTFGLDGKWQGICVDPARSFFQRLMTRASLDALTGIRFFAALHIVLLHFYRPLFGWGPLRWLSRLVDVGYVSVGLFFTLSGFILVYNYIDLELAPLHFWRARLARIYPAYLLSFLISLPLLFIKLWTHSQELIFMCTGPCTPGRVVTGLILYPLLLQDWDPHATHMINAPAWSLSAEAFFYLVFPLLVMKFARLRSKTCLQLAGVCWLASLAISVLLFLYLPQRPGVIDDPVARFVSTSPLLHLISFVCGMLTGCVFSRTRNLRHTNGDFLVLLGVAIVVIVVYAPPRLLPAVFFNNGILIPAWCCLIFGLALGGYVSRIVSHPVLLLLGNASYATYILQAPIHSYFRGAGMLPGPDLFGTEFHHFVPALSFITLLLIASVVVHQSIEIPGRRLLLSFGRKLPALARP